MMMGSLWQQGQERDKRTSGPGQEWALYEVCVLYRTLQLKMYCNMYVCTVLDACWWRTAVKGICRQDPPE